MRVWLFASKECKCELREHDHVVEDIAWAPDSANTHVNEAAVTEVRIEIKVVVYIHRYFVLFSLFSKLDELVKGLVSHHVIAGFWYCFYPT